jgi:hypothetical protein
LSSDERFPALVVGECAFVVCPSRVAESLEPCGGGGVTERGASVAFRCTEVRIPAMLGM